MGRALSLGLVAHPVITEEEEKNRRLLPTVVRRLVRRLQRDVFVPSFIADGILRPAEFMGDEWGRGVSLRELFQLVHRRASPRFTVIRRFLGQLIHSMKCPLHGSPFRQ